MDFYSVAVSIFTALIFIIPVVKEFFKSKKDWPYIFLMIVLGIITALVTIKADARKELAAMNQAEEIAIRIDTITKLKENLKILLSEVHRIDSSMLAAGWKHDSKTDQWSFYAPSATIDYSDAFHFGPHSKATIKGVQFRSTIIQNPTNGPTRQ